jgi:hypothetical protein
MANLDNNDAKKYLENLPNLHFGYRREYYQIQEVFLKSDSRIDKPKLEGFCT